MIGIIIALLLTGAADSVIRPATAATCKVLIPTLNYFVRRSYSTFPPLVEVSFTLESILFDMFLAVSFGLCAFLLAAWFYAPATEERNEILSR